RSALTPQKAAVARRLYDSREHTVAEIAKVLGVSRATIYRHLTPTS
ncbi:MAG: helix-turn-helix domain-containing protein, partial [Nocardioidaceae bacterium]